MKPKNSIGKWRSAERRKSLTAKRLFALIFFNQRQLDHFVAGRRKRGRHLRRQFPIQFWLKLTPISSNAMKISRLFIRKTKVKELDSRLTPRLVITDARWSTRYRRSVKTTNWRNPKALRRKKSMAYWPLTESIPR